MFANCLVSIRCTVYNHEPYLRQCLDGFVMQKTNFAFEAIVHDDASTDGSANIIREYAEKYPDVIKPIYETENQYSKHDGSLRRIMDSAISPSSKYIALCEGDDYWTDPYKLQKQVDYLESHPECTMVCNRTKKYSEKDKHFIEDSFCLEKDGILETKDVIRKGGLYISTCSLIYRISLLENYPDYCRQCHVGDYPLQIMAAVCGRIYYMNHPMSVYRVNVPNSWTGNNFGMHNLTQAKINGIKSEVFMLRGFMSDKPQYGKFFQDRISFYINFFFKKYNTSRDYELLMNAFSSEIKQYPLLWTIHFKMILCKSRVLNYIYYKVFFKRLKTLFY